MLAEQLDAASQSSLLREVKPVPPVFELVGERSPTPLQYELILLSRQDSCAWGSGSSSGDGAVGGGIIDS